ncbi:hypothetical protein [Streptomyces microflavus]|uniref:hypothetical protein n=1 Tax=Streptomyces microflavus TaxID=1919 RepID=UPI0036C5C765
MPEDLGGWIVRWHALQRALDMALEGNEIRRCLLTPTEVRQNAAKLPPERKLYIHGRIALAVNEANREVITVLWNSGGAMSRKDDDELWWRD